MNYEETKAEVIKHCRKNFGCEWCAETIQKGSACFYREYRIGEAFVEGRMHPECALAMKKSEIQRLLSGWTPGDQKRGQPMGEPS